MPDGDAVPVAWPDPQSYDASRLVDAEQASAAPGKSLRGFGWLGGGAGEVDGAGGVEGLVRVPGRLSVQQDSVSVAVAAGLPDRECPFAVVAEVLDAA